MHRRWRTIIVGVLAVLGLWLGSGILLRFLYGSEAGGFGDMFGAVNALFSGLALAGIIYTILLQQHELKLQRRELELTRGELAGQKEQFQIQNETLITQKFESTFFHLLSLRREIISSMNNEVEGKNVFLEAARFIENYKERGSLGWAKVERDIHSETLWEKMDSDFGEDYDFDVLYKNLNMLCDLLEANKHSQDTNFYGRIISAHLESDEQRVLLYEIFRKQDPLGLMQKIERHGLFDDFLDGEEEYKYIKKQIEKNRNDLK